MTATPNFVCIILLIYDASKLSTVYVVKSPVLGLQRAPEKSELAPSVLVLSALLHSLAELYDQSAIEVIHSKLLNFPSRCPSRNINDCLMERQDAAMTILQDHVIVAVFAETDSPLIGLRNLVMPIRASNIHYKDLIHVVIVGNVDYLKSKFR